MASYGALVREVGGSWREDSITLQPHQLVNLHAKLIAQSTAQEERDQFLALLKRLEPHLDAIVCHASTMNEHEPNRLAYEVRAAIAKATGGAYERLHVPRDRRRAARQVPRVHQRQACRA